MKYHDILNIYITASPEQIEKAYDDKLAALSRSDIAPSLKLKKAAELSKAREDCHAYFNKCFHEKCFMEIEEMGRTALEPNRMNDCCTDYDKWCMSCCGNCCSCVCYGTIGAAVLGTVCCITSNMIEKKRAEEEKQRRIEEEEEAKKKSKELNSLIEQKTKLVAQCEAKRTALAAELNHRQEQLKFQTEMYEENCRKIIVFCNNIGLELTESQILNSPAVIAMKREVLALDKEVAKAETAIRENESLISSSKKDAENAKNELHNIGV